MIRIDNKLSDAVIHRYITPVMFPKTTNINTFYNVRTIPSYKRPRVMEPYHALANWKCVAEVEQKIVVLHQLDLDMWYNFVDNHDT